MALTPLQARKVVCLSIEDAGGFTGPHAPATTLDGAGLISLQERQQFRRRTKPRCRAYAHDIDIRHVPFAAATTVKQAEHAVQEHATPLTRLKRRRKAKAKARSALAAVVLSLWGIPAGAQALEPATSKAEADIFLAGSLTAASNADTIYAWDIKVTYPKLERPLGSSANHWLVASPRLEFMANKGTNANPDRISIGGSAEILFFTSEATRRLLSTVNWANVVAGEFDRDRTTKALAVQTLTRFMFRTFLPAPSFEFLPMMESGFETGNNVQNKLSPTGSGPVARLYAGVNVTQRLGQPGIALTGTYQVRRPLRDEVSLRVRRTATEIVLSTRTRQYAEIGLVFTPSQVKFLAIRPTYKRGSLPPAFTYVDNEFSLSFQFAAKDPMTIKTP